MEGTNSKKPGRTRKSNWTPAEIDTLFEEIEKAKFLIGGKVYAEGEKVTPQEKFRAWATVAHKINSVAPCKRTVHEVRKKWQDMKVIARKKEASIRAKGLRQGIRKNVQPTTPAFAGSSYSSSRRSDPPVMNSSDCVNNMSLYLDCIETFQENMSDDDEREGGQEVSLKPASSVDTLTNLEWEDRSRLLGSVDWETAPGSSKQKALYSDQLLEIEKEKLKIKKEKLKVLKELVKIQKERLAFEKRKQQNLYKETKEAPP